MGLFPEIFDTGSGKGLSAAPRWRELPRSCADVAHKSSLQKEASGEAIQASFFKLVYEKTEERFCS